jgi:signal transduction histidine kinase
MKSRLEILIALPTFIVITLLLVVSAAAEVWLQSKQSEEILHEQAYILSQEMQAAWDFVSVNQDRINTDGDGSYTFKGLHCSIAGTSIGALFTNRTDYVIRYASDHPRNKANLADDFELDAIDYFRANSRAKEYCQTNFLLSDAEYYRYAVPLVMGSECVGCHGDPAGKVDVTGYPKEGMQKGDLVGIASISIPVGSHKEDLKAQIVQRVLLSTGVLAACFLTITLVTRRYVIHPLRKVEGAVQKLGSGDMSTHIDVDAINARGEINVLSGQFNNMASELDALHKHLEEMVATRTEQLADANETLAEQAAKLEEMNRRLTENDLYKSHFFTMMSHELRTPTTVIRAYIDMLEDEGGLDDEARRNAVKAIRTNAQSLSKLVDSILESARMEAGAVKLEKTVVDAADIMVEVEKTLEPLAQDKNIDFRVSYGNTPLFMADANKLLHILENLGSNAIKYTGPGGEVSVSASLDEGAGEMRFVVSDNGIGISEADQQVVFEKFKQAGSSVSRPVSGSGLGLALAKEYAELHGGSILLESALGQGSEFTVCIPFEEPDFGFE